jgi:tellurite resistance protein TehA-like permease
MPTERPERSGSALADLSPANFAIVMATGILGIAAGQQGFGTLSLAMLAFNALAWPTLVALTVARLLRHRAALLADLRSHQRAPGFFAAVAGTSVLASQLIAGQLADAPGVALAGLAVLLWLGLTYGILVTLTVQPDKPTLAEGINGAWLLTVVSTQSIAVVAALIAPHTPQPARLALNFGALALWLCGGMLYAWVASIIFYRFAFLRFEPRDLTPTSWINMGAMAISTLAGTLLVLNAPDAPLLLALLPFVKGGTVLFWAVGTWWIPMLLALAVWRYGHRRYPLRYEPAYWGAVFPLGMYSAATHQMTVVLGLRFLAPLARGFFFVAMPAWLLAAVGLAVKVRSTLRA